MKKRAKDFWSLEGMDFDSAENGYEYDFDLDEIENLTTEDVINFIDREDASETELDLEDLAERHFDGSRSDFEAGGILDSSDIPDPYKISLDRKRKTSGRKG
jgi:hypothetical protein